MLWVPWLAAGCQEGAAASDAVHTIPTACTSAAAVGAQVYYSL
jgi:hypothetical protein